MGGGMSLTYYSGITESALALQHPTSSCEKRGPSDFDCWETHSEEEISKHSDLKYLDHIILFSVQHVN